MAFAFKGKAVEFADVLKMGRTQLQDAVPMTLGQEFDAFHATMKEDVARLQRGRRLVPRGQPRRHRDRHRHQRRPALRRAGRTRSWRALPASRWCSASNLIEATSDMGAFVLFSGVLKRIAVKLSKICNDLRLLSQRPAHRLRRNQAAGGAGRLLDHAGQGQPGDPGSGQPGRLLVIGHDLTVTMCAEGGQLQLNAFEPTIGYCVLASLEMLTAAIDTLTRMHRRHRGRPRALPRAGRQQHRTVTALVPALGYETCSRIAKQALAENRRVADIVLEEGLLDQGTIDLLLRAEAMTSPAVGRDRGTPSAR